MSFKPPKQWVLTETETITSFANWLSSINYHLSLNNEFSLFIEDSFTWSVQSVANRGLTDDGEDVAAAQRKTAAQKKLQLERMLGLIAQFSPSLLRSDIIKKSTGLNWIWDRIRRYYSFSQSEVNFLRLSTIKLQEGERYATLFQRIIAHLDDNLLTTASGLQHDGAAVTLDEVMSPTAERLAVYLWLNLIDERLPSYISRIYAHELQVKSLKDIQPQICDAMDSILHELNTQEEIQVNYSRSSYSSQRKPGTMSRRNQNYSSPRSFQNAPSNRRKTCGLCKSANRPYQGHDIGSCWYISKIEKMEMAAALQVETNGAPEEESMSSDEVVQCIDSHPACEMEKSTVARVQCNTSPWPGS